MANTFMETAQRIKTEAGTLLEKIGKNRQSAAELLTRAKLAENALVEKERARKKEQEEKEKEERLARFLQEGGNTYTTEQPAPVASVEAPKQAPNEAVPAAPAAEPAPAPAAKEEKPAEVKSAEPAQAEEKPAEPKPEARPVRNEQRTGDRPNDQRQQRTGDRPYEQRQQRTGDKPYEQRQPRTGDRPNDQRQQRTGDRPFGRGPRPGQNDNRPPRTGDRPNDRGPRPGAAATPESMAVTKPGAAQNHRAVVISDGKTDPKKKFDTEKKAKNKKAIQKEAAPVKTDWDEEGPMGNRRKGPGKKQAIAAKPTPVVIDHAIITTETITVKDLSEKIGKPAAEIIKKLFMVGIMATINQEINFDACELIAADYGITLEQQIAKTFEDVLDDSATVEDTEDQLKPRPPVVTIMGHVDHGKTSLLDAFRHSSVAAGEAGGITQHIGAYTVTCNGRQITFIDTPGHEAFTSMRARGAQVTDVVILVVAADDGIMPQTIEAINHAKSAGVPIVVAINKIDRPNADPDRVQQQLTEYGLVSEDWGGDTIVVPVSAKQKINLDTLLEMVLLQADVLELKANPNRLAKGTIIEAKLDKNRGPVATVLVQNGTLKKGDTIIAGTAYGRIRAMIDDKGRSVNSAGPSMPVEILGFNEVPEAGDILNVADADKLTRQVAEERRDKIKAAQIAAKQRVSLDELFNQMAEGELKDLNIIVKADVQGSVEAIKQAFEKLSNEEVRVRVIHGAVGAITESDIMFASASNAIVIGFNVRPDASAKTVADKEKVDVRIYRVIYSAIEDIQAAMKGMFKPVFKEVELGRATVRSTFKISGVGTIAGAYINDGKVARNAQVRVVRDGVILYDGKIASLKRFKDDAKEVASGYECGISFENFNDLREGDVIEAYVMEQVEKE